MKNNSRGTSDRDHRARQAERLARILSGLRLIQSGGQWNARAIAQELEVTERTVYRDLLHEARRQIRQPSGHARDQ